MSEPSKSPTTARILVVLDASPYGLAALDTAARLASELQAELQGLFVEDVDLLRLAQLPFAREVTYPSASQRSLSPAEVERTLRSTAEQLRSAVSIMAESLQVKWSFQVARGQITRSALAAAEQADLLVMGRECRAPREASHPTLAGAARQGPILCVYDGSAAGRRAVDAAARLARKLDGQLVVLLSAASQQEAAMLRADINDWQAGQNLPGSTIDLPAGGPVGIARVARQYRAGLVVLNRDNRLLDEAIIENLVRDLDCPVGLVR